MSGQYLRARLELRFGIFSALMGWPGGRVACYTTVATVDSGAKVFLALFGSASNVHGYRDEGGTGFYPSDLFGLLTMLDLVREPQDPRLDDGYLWNDGSSSDEARASEAITLAQGGASTPIGEHEFLARAFIAVDDYLAPGEFEGKVVLGTPLWVATPLPAPYGSGGRNRP
jgi:hypothetical protein